MSVLGMGIYSIGTTCARVMPPDPLNAYRFVVAFATAQSSRGAKLHRRPLATRATRC